jgi:hypothetical protein
MNRQTFIISLDTDLAGRVQRVVTDGNGGYRSLDDLVSLALRNQLGADASRGAQLAGHSTASGSPPLHGLLARPRNVGSVDLADAALSEDPLFTLTNRLSPLKVATRVLCNLKHLVERLPDRRVWPTVKTFRTTAGHAARALGFELRRQDEVGSVSGRDKRSVGYPIGREERASLERFAVSFTLTASPRVVSGPLVVLGLATPIDGGRVALTDAGLRLAIAPSPLLDDAGAGTLSAQERDVLVAQIGQAPGECAAVVEFLHLVVETDGRQTRVDGALGRRHPAWSVNRTIAERAAMVGRLAELELLRVDGRGAGARLALGPAATAFLAGQADAGDDKPRSEERRP